ncbi:MAG: hypothetical protein OEZ19_03160, partial [Paracoccaceae bacterium]|nr:hypothetical protein [Paracoccaceae bacterium]
SGPVRKKTPRQYETWDTYNYLCGLDVFPQPALEIFYPKVYKPRAASWQLDSEAFHCLGRLISFYRFVILLRKMESLETSHRLPSRLTQLCC